MRALASADPAAAEDDVAVVEDGGLAGSDGALRGVKDYARGGSVTRFDGRGSGFVLVADLGVRSKRAGRLSAGNPIHTFDFTGGLSENVVFADDDAILFRINR